jgi:hypothetical protein
MKSSTAKTTDKTPAGNGATRLIKTASRRLPTSEYVEVTPLLARQWLATAARNRKIHEIWIERYAERMKRGDWMVTDQGIAFNDAEELIDGQHRLHAVVRANRTITMLVTRGLDQRAQLVMDQGIRRQVHEQIALRENWEVAPIHLAIAKAMISGVGGAGDRERQSISSDPQLMERFYKHHHQAIEWTAVQFTHEPFVKGVSIAPVMAPVARAWYAEDHAELMSFCRVVVTGMSEHRNDQAAVALRNWLIAGRERGLSTGTSKRILIYKKTEIALRAFLKAEQLERIGQRQLDRELWPIPGEEGWKKGERLVLTEA